VISVLMAPSRLELLPGSETGYCCGFSQPAIAQCDTSADVECHLWIESVDRSMSG
jgi:hypothetical protein